MAVQVARNCSTRCAVGDTVRGTVTGEAENTGAGLVLCGGRQSGDTYLLHDNTAYPLLVWLHDTGEEYGTHACGWSILQWLRQRFPLLTETTIAAIAAYHHVRLYSSRVRLSLNPFDQCYLSGVLYALLPYARQARHANPSQSDAGDMRVCLWVLNCTWQTLLWNAWLPGRCLWEPAWCCDSGIAMHLWQRLR